MGSPLYIIRGFYGSSNYSTDGFSSLSFKIFSSWSALDSFFHAFDHSNLDTHRNFLSYQFHQIYSNVPVTSNFLKRTSSIKFSQIFPSNFLKRTSSIKFFHQIFSNVPVPSNFLKFFH